MRPVAAYVLICESLIRLKRPVAAYVLICESSIRKRSEATITHRRCGIVFYIRSVDHASRWLRVRPRNGEKFTRRRSFLEFLGVTTAGRSEATTTSPVRKFGTSDVAVSGRYHGPWGRTFGEDEEWPLTSLWRRPKSAPSRSVAEVPLERLSAEERRKNFSLAKRGKIFTEWRQPGGAPQGRRRRRSLQEKYFGGSTS